MTRIVGWLIFVILAIIALLHVYWGLGGLWPAETLPELINTVVGDSRMTAMPPVGLTIIVALLIFAAGWIALERSDVAHLLPNWITKMGSWTLVFVFGLRGLSSYFFAAGVYGNTTTLAEPFATYDVWIYGPLCLLLAAGFLFLSLSKS